TPAGRTRAAPGAAARSAGRTLERRTAFRSTAGRARRCTCRTAGRPPLWISYTSRDTTDATARRLLRTGGGLHVLTGSHFDERSQISFRTNFARAGRFFGRPRPILSCRVAPVPRSTDQRLRLLQDAWKPP